MTLLKFLVQEAVSKLSY